MHINAFFFSVVPKRLVLTVCVCSFQVIRLPPTFWELSYLLYESVNISQTLNPASRWTLHLFRVFYASPLLTQFVDTPATLSTGEAATKTCCVAVTQPQGQNERHTVTTTKLSPSVGNVHPPSRHVLESTRLKSSRMSTRCDVIFQMNNWENWGWSSQPPALPRDSDAPDANVSQQDPHGTRTLPPATLIALLSRLRVTGAYWEPRQGGVGVLHISPHTEYALLASWEAIRFSFAASPQASPSIIWRHLMLCASKCGLEAPFGRWPLTNRLHVMAANVRHLLYIDKQESSEDDRCPHTVVESAVINAGCDVVMAAVVSIILLVRAKSSF